VQHRIRIGYQVDFAPFMSASDSGPVGLVIEVLVPALQAADLAAEWVPLQLTDQIDALLGGRVDMLGALGVTSQRKEQVQFGRPIVRTGGALYRLIGRSGPPSRIATPGAGPLLASTRRTFPDGEVIEALDYPDALRRVVDGTADAAALNLHVGATFAEREHTGAFELPTEPFEVVELAPAYPPTSTLALPTLPLVGD
jgi:ABC-type amino acid transport substrate-binding protein